MGIFLGDRPVSVFFNGAAAGLPVQGVFLGGIQVFPTGTAAEVPGKPTIIAALSQGAGFGEISFTPPADGGSPITGYNVYSNGSLVNAGVPDGVQLLSLDFEEGDFVEIAAVNAVGEGPRSDAVIAD